MAPKDPAEPADGAEPDERPDEADNALSSDIEVVEVVPGELDVQFVDRRLRVLIPAGVGIPGVADGDLAAALVTELRARGATLPDVIDVSAVLSVDPGVLDAVAARLGA